MSGPLDYPGEARTYGDHEVFTEHDGTDDEMVVEHPDEPLDVETLLRIAERLRR